jgi:alkylhydroperoxidase family enzyme
MQQGLSDELYQHVNEYRGRDEFTRREKLAIEYAERFALDHRQIGSEFIERLRAEYCDEEVIELAALVAFCMGVGRIYTVLEIANECAIVL